MKRSTAFRILAALLARVCLAGLMSGCGPTDKQIQERQEARNESLAASREAESIAESLLDQSRGESTQETNPPDDTDDPIIPGKWVLTNSRLDQIAQSSTDGDGDYVNTYECSLYEHSAAHSYDPEERIDEEDKPWSVRYVCSCVLSGTEIRPGESLSIGLKAKTDYYDKQIFGMCCRIYFDRSWLDEAVVSDHGYDYSGYLLYPVHVGDSCGPGYGHALDEPWSDGDGDTLTVAMPIVRQSTLRKYSEFTIQFATDVGNSYFEFTWVSD